MAGEEEENFFVLFRFESQENVVTFSKSKQVFKQKDIHASAFV